MYSLINSRASCVVRDSEEEAVALFFFIGTAACRVGATTTVANGHYRHG